MTDGTAEGGVISKVIKRIFQRVGEITDENHKKNRVQNTALRNSSLDRKRGSENAIKGQMLIATESKFTKHRNNFSSTFPYSNLK